MEWSVSTAKEGTSEGGRAGRRRVNHCLIVTTRCVDAVACRKGLAGARRAFAMASAMTCGIGSVVSPEVTTDEGR